VAYHGLENEGKVFPECICI